MCAELGGEPMRRRVLGVSQGNNQGIVYGLTDGTYESLDGSVVTISDGNHVYAKSSTTGGRHTIWLYPSCVEYKTFIDSFVDKASYPSDVLFSLKSGDVVRFVVSNNNTAITNKWQDLYIGLANGANESIVSGKFQQKTELTTEVTVTEDIDITALFVHINRYSTEAEFDLEVYVNDVRYF